ncbi:unnamed protein product [Symbiodinium sp. CCMP2456]|nr:unnamed protein product [Symbiodinium sp. CCMP2456]
MVKTAAKSYLLGMELLQWLAAMEHRDGWASKMKATKSLQPDKLQKWIRSPSDDLRLMEALLAAYRSQVDVRPEGKSRGLSDSDGSEQAVAKSTSSPRSDSDDSDDRRGEKRKKKAKKDSDSSKDKKSKKKEKERRGKKGKKEDHPKKKKKAGKDKKSHKTSSSSGKTSKAEDKKPSPEDDLTLKIRRVTGLTAEGRIAVKDTDLYDEIQFDSAEATLTDVLVQFFEAQSSKEEFDNWSVKALIQGKCVEISAPTTPATLCKEALRSTSEEAYEKAMARLLETKSAAAVLKIRRVSGISAAGKVLVKDTDLCDEVEVDDTDTLLIEVLRGFFRTQSAEEDLSNWKIKALVSGKCIDVNAETTPAMLCSDVVLCKKGG